MLKRSHFAVQKDGIMYHARARHTSQFGKTAEDARGVSSASKYQRAAADMKI